MGKETIIEVDGRVYNATYIGRGKFSKVYRVGDRVVYYTKGDCAKEAMALFQYDKMTHLPEIIVHDDIRGRSLYYKVYSAPYYRNVTKKDYSAWLLMKKLIKLYSDYISYLHRQGIRFSRNEGYEMMQMFVDDVADQLPNSVIRALQHMLDLARNCGNNIYWDFHKRNFGVNEYGTLIFRDVIFLL